MLESYIIDQQMDLAEFFSRYRFFGSMTITKMFYNNNLNINSFNIAFAIPIKQNTLIKKKSVSYCDAQPFFWLGKSIRLDNGDYGGGALVV